jgi:hypothetical protein
VNTKERTLMIWMEYSVLKEEMEDDECGWSKHRGMLNESTRELCFFTTMLLLYKISFGVLCRQVH